MIDFMKYTNDELQNLSNAIEAELTERKNKHYENLVRKVLDAIYEIDDIDTIAFSNGHDSWTWEELANSIKYYHF